MKLQKSSINTIKMSKKEEDQSYYNQKNKRYEKYTKKIRFLLGF